MNGLHAYDAKGGLFHLMVLIMNETLYQLSYSPDTT